MGVAVKVNISIDLYQVAGTLACGMEGGINYWAQILDYKKPPELTHTLDKLSNAHFRKKRPDLPENVYRHIDYPLNPGGSVTIKLTEAGVGELGDTIYELTHAKLLEGIEVMARDEPQHFANMISGNDDSTTGDVLVQCALFGRVVFG